MTPTRLSTLALLAVGTALVAFLLVGAVYGDLPPLPAYAPGTLVLLALAELGMARTVRSRLRGGPVRGRALHPLQVARAAVVAKASSAAAALLAGLYGGFLAQVLPMDAASARRDARTSAVSVGAAALLAVAALLLERACRTPDDDG